PDVEAGVLREEARSGGCLHDGNHGAVAHETARLFAEGVLVALRLPRAVDPLLSGSLVPAGSLGIIAQAALQVMSVSFEEERVAHRAGPDRIDWRHLLQ